MEPQELRIGNLLYKQIPKTDTPVEVVEILSIDGSFEMLEVKNTELYITEECPLDKFEPIPLTEEWLLKFGFKQYETVVIKTHNYIKGNFKFNSAVLWIAEYKGIHIENKILYVHQLQNLYFVLTGEELTLK